MENEAQPTPPPIQPPPQISPSVPPSTKLPKILLFSILGLIVIAGSIFIGIHIGKNQVPNPTRLTPTPTPTNTTSNWKTYNNAKANISFKYPPDWELTFGESNHMAILLKKEDITQAKADLPGNTQQYAEYDISIDLPPNENVSTPGKFEPITVDGISGIKFIQGAAPSSGPTTTVQITKDYLIYLFNYGAMAHPETHNKYLIIFDQILSTFKFISTLSTDQRWTKVSDSRYENINKCMWIDITKINSLQNLYDYLKAYYQTSDLTGFLNPTQYPFAGYESKTISSQGIGEMFSVYLKKDNTIYSFSFNSAVPEGGTNDFINMCQKYPEDEDINSAINSLPGFL